ncbi:unnamed protein product [Eruca vesicaria subsp. sativa]|uniref:Protein kinase domain-containing protein n=1 Tax=Eruca vesicaria subsp. sativa TaxID=29727 RepID=A0ABC8M9C4_ERUVS|nr:unnamed protein product [Eruca vesicaria subsp. sativa]
MNDAVKDVRIQPGTRLPILDHIQRTGIEMLSQFIHMHFVSLILYEYMEHGRLKDHFYASDNPRLSWRQRLEICVGAARGLRYLHTDFLLPKTDMDLYQTHVSMPVKGSFRYLDPEYLTKKQLTENSDLYSFGVVML